MRYLVRGWLKKEGEKAIRPFAYSIDAKSDEEAAKIVYENLTRRGIKDVRIITVVPHECGL